MKGKRVEGQKEVERRGGEGRGNERRENMRIWKV